MGDDRERPRRSWREIDQMRSSGRRPSPEDRPRSKADQARVKAATEQYLKDADKLFSKAKGGAEGEALAKALRDAHGSDALPEACRAYLDALGAPDDPSLLAIFLDTGDAAFVVPAIEALDALREKGALSVTPGLRSQLRVLSQDFDADIAEAAEELLEAI